MFEKKKCILILAPHPDDAEFGLGGTMKKLLDEEKDIHIAVFSDCEKSTPPGFEIGVIKKEFYSSCDFFGIQKSNIHFFNFEVRNFPSQRQEILESMITLRNLIQPDLVFMPSSSDIHQDHNVIHQEGLRAFKHTSLLGYEMPWNNFGFTSFVYIALNDAHLSAKIKALSIYKSQNTRDYSDRNFVEALATLRGHQIKEKYAESFELIRYIEK